MVATCVSARVTPTNKQLALRAIRNKTVLKGVLMVVIFSSRGQAQYRGVSAPPKNVVPAESCRSAVALWSVAYSAALVCSQPNQSDGKRHTPNDWNSFHRSKRKGVSVP